MYVQESKWTRLLRHTEDNTDPAPAFPALCWFSICFAYFPICWANSRGFNTRKKLIKAKTNLIKTKTETKTETVKQELRISRELKKN